MEDNKISLVSNILVSDEHEGFNKNKIIKKYTILQDKEWTGGDVFDDYC